MGAPRAEHPVTLVIAKEGDLCFLGHLDFARAVERALRRSGLPLRFTEGFHRRVKLRLPEPLPVGVGSEGERFVAPLSEPRSPEQVAAALDGRFPRGLRLVRAVAGAHPEPPDVPLEIELEAADAAGLEAALRSLPAQVPAIGGAWALLEAPSGAGRCARAVVKLVPRPGQRVSVGRFLETVRQAAPGLAVTRVHRRVAWHALPASLPSCALPPAPDRAEAVGSQEASSCTP